MKNLKIKKQELNNDILIIILKGELDISVVEMIELESLITEKEIFKYKFFIIDMKNIYHLRSLAIAQFFKLDKLLSTKKKKLFFINLNDINLRIMKTFGYFKIKTNLDSVLNEIR